MENVEVSAQAVISKLLEQNKKLVLEVLLVKEALSALKSQNREQKEHD